MKYKYEAQIVNEENDEVLIKVWSYSEEGMEEEMGKTKWTGAVERYEAEKEKEEMYLGKQKDAEIRASNPDEPADERGFED